MPRLPAQLIVLVGVIQSIVIMLKQRVSWHAVYLGIAPNAQSQRDLPYVRSACAQ